MKYDKKLAVDGVILPENYIVNMRMKMRMKMRME